VSDQGILENLLDGAEVEWRPLGKVVDVRRGKRLVKSQLEEAGPFAVFQNSMTPLGYYHEANVEAGSAFIICAGAAGSIGYSEPEFWAADDVYFFVPPKGIISRFIYHWLLLKQGWISSQVRKGVVPRLPKPVVERLSIPIPSPDDLEKSLAIQSEIVRILDTFIELTAELTTELAARKKQYNYYRDQLLTFPDEDVRWTKFVDVADFRRGTAITKKETTEGNVPVVANGPVPSYSHGEHNREGETVVVARSGAYAGYVSYWNQPIFLTDAFSVHPHPNAMTPKFVYHVLQNKQAQLHAMKKGAGVPHVRVKEMEQYDVPVPNLETQHRIVSILEKFDTLTTSLSEGLPREIALRQQQYEYYRDLLLSFPNPAEVVEA
jgi:type I restriction enzyme, S subunit